MDIHQAILVGDFALVKEMIELGADVNKLKNDSSPLLLAISEQNWKIVYLLLDSGAIPITQVLDFIISEIGFDDILIRNTLVTELINAGMDINDRVEDGETILMAASSSGRFELVKLLVQAGADVNAISRKADFALSCAASARHEEMFKYLIPLTSSRLKDLAVTQGIPSRFIRWLKN